MRTFLGTTDGSFWTKDNRVIIFSWKKHVLKQLVNYLSATLMKHISMGYVTGNFSVDATKISD